MASKNNRRRTLQLASQQAVVPSTGRIASNLAIEQPILFGFRYLNLNRNPCRCVDGTGLVATYRILIDFSPQTRKEVLGRPNCHHIDEDTIKQFNLQDLLIKGSVNKLHQVGKKASPERIIGFFDNTAPNVFQVCLIDTKHQLYREV